jgi:hypothetical protein
MAVSLDGPVGLRFRTQNVTNNTSDQEKVVRLLAAIPGSQGGMKETWGELLPLWGPDGHCAQDLADAIWNFQSFWKAQGVFHNIDGVVDRGMHTLAQMNQLVSAAPSTPQFPGTLKVLVQFTAMAVSNAQSAGTQAGATAALQLAYSGKASTLLAPFGLALDVQNGANVPILSPVDQSFPFDDVKAVRAAAGKAAPGLADRVRVIFCPFTRKFENHFGASYGRPEGLDFDDFTLINTNRLSKDLCTMLHEMIHDTGLRNHDEDTSSVFALGENRTVLRPEHAERLSKMFFFAAKTP